MSQQHWQERYASQRVWSGEPHEQVVRLAKRLTPGRFCDLACGEGADAVWLAQHRWRGVAVDFAPAALAHGRHTAEQAGVADRIEWLERDVTDRTGLRTDPPPVSDPAPAPNREHPLSPSGYDLVVVCFLHAPPDARRRAHHIAWQLTGPGGTLLIVGHHPDNADQGHGGPPDPSLLYSPEEVLDSLTLTTDDPQVIRGVRHARHPDSPDRIMFDTIVELRRTADGH